jgi:FtsZ-binding cell division protein ZapB
MKMPIEERKEYVINLHKKGYPIRPIAKILHMSTRDVEKIVKEYKNEEKETREIDVIEKEEKTKEQLFSSKRSEALKLYKKGTMPLDVAIELEISAEDANTFYQEFCSLQYPPQLLQIYTELTNTNSFIQFSDLFHLVRQKKLSIEQGVEAIEMINDISLLKEEHRDLSNRVADLEKSEDFLTIENKTLRDQNDELNKRLNSKLEKIETADRILEIKNKEIRYKEQTLFNINTGKDYDKARYQIKQLVELFLGNKKKVIGLAVLCLFKAVKENHQKEIPIKDLSKSIYQYVSDSSDKDLYQQKLQDVAEKLWYSIADVCADDFLSHPSNILEN